MSVSEASERIVEPSSLSEREFTLQFFAESDDSENEEDSFAEVAEQTAEDLESEQESSDTTDESPDENFSDEPNSDDSDPSEDEDELEESESSNDSDSEQDGDSDEDSDEEEPRIPKSRLDEVIGQRDEWKGKAQNYAQTIRQYQNNPEKAQELVQDYINRGLIEPEDVLPDDVEGLSENHPDSDKTPQSAEEMQNRLEQLFPEESARVIREAVETYTSQDQQDENPESNADETEGRSPEVVQQQTRAQIDSMKANEEHFPHFEEVFEETVGTDDMGNEMTLADQVAKQNPEEFVLENVQYQTEDGQVFNAYDPNKLDELYFRAVAQTDFVDQKIEEAESQGRQEVQEQLDKNKDEAPAEPAGGTTPSGPTKDPEEVESFEEAVEMAEEQLAS
jgi:hypothetical protein